MQIRQVFEVQAARSGAAGAEELQGIEHAPFGAARSLAGLLNDVFLGKEHAAAVEAAAAGLCRQLLAGWLETREQLQQEMVEAVVAALPVIAAGDRRRSGQDGSGSGHTSAGAQGC
jgi:hypothetical protein